MKERIRQIQKCHSCGLPNPITDEKKSLCEICTLKGTSEPIFEAITLSMAVGFYQNVKKYDLNSAICKARDYISHQPYWQTKNIPTLEDLHSKHELSKYIRNSMIQFEQMSYDFLILYINNTSIKKTVDDFIKILESKGKRVLRIEREERKTFSDENNIITDNIKLKTFSDNLNNVSYCIPILSTTLFTQVPLVSELAMMLSSKLKNQILPVWCNDITRDFLEKQLIVKEILGIVGIPWKEYEGNGDKLTNIILDNISKLSGKKEYNGVLLSIKETEAMEALEKVTGSCIPKIIMEKVEEEGFGYVEKDGHVKILKIRVKKDGRGIGPIIFPISCQNLENLRYLVVNISSVPEWIEKFKELEILNLKDNILHILPDSIGNLPTLEILILDSNNLKNLPESIGNLKSLKKLHLGSLHLESIPKSIANLQLLELIDLQSNHLQSISESMCKLKSLIHVDLSFNDLKSLPENIGNLTSLEGLNLSHNKLTSLPESIGDLHSLKQLEIDNNPLTCFPENIINLSSIKKITVDNNNIKIKFSERLRKWWIILNNKGCVEVVDNLIWPS